MTERHRSTAVMARRRDAKGLQYFPTPPWAVRALFAEKIDATRYALRTCWEPACGGGHLVAGLQDVFPEIYATDIFDWGFGDRRDLDFTFADDLACPFVPDWIVTNPPFTLGEAFLDRALQLARVGVALLLRIQWLEGGDRYRTIFGTDRAPTLVCPFADRVPMIEEAWDPEAKSATAYAWFVWIRGRFGEMRINHIRPGAERRYTRLGDERLMMRGEAERRRRERQAANG
ncbi:MAG: SAM-dependent DNA methyltransferase [Nitratireductor sp.]|nr:SAM-dependent DNA methyltransferase [Nitratireductor sp.]